MSHPLPLVREFGPPLRGLVHVGANVGQEFADYAAAGLSPVVYVEANPDIHRRLTQNISAAPGHIAVNALCAEADGERRTFHISSNDSNSSSMLDFGWHTRSHPDVTWTGEMELTTSRLDTVMAICARAHPEFAWDAIDALVLDVQGAEMRVLRGAPDLISRVRCIWSEVNEGGLYQNDCSAEELSAYLRDFGFRMKFMSINRHGWGDALFIRGSPADG